MTWRLAEAERGACQRAVHERSPGWVGRWRRCRAGFRTRFLVVNGARERLWRNRCGRDGWPIWNCYDAVCLPNYPARSRRRGGLGPQRVAQID